MQNTQTRTGAGGVMDLYLRPLDNLFAVALYAADQALEVTLEFWDEEGLTVPVPQSPSVLDCNLIISKTQTDSESLGAILRDVCPGISTNDNEMRQAGYPEAALWSRTLGQAVGGILVNNGGDRVYYNVGGTSGIPASGNGIRPGCNPGGSSARWLEPGDSLVFGRATL